MFKIRDNAITPRKSLYENALRRLPEAHQAAQQAGISHLHGAMQQAAQDADLDPEPVKIGRKGPTLFVGIDETPAGNKLADNEFGMPDEAPNPVLRTAARAAHPEAQRRYSTVLRNGLGI